MSDFAWYSELSYSSDLIHERPVGAKGERVTSSLTPRVDGRHSPDMAGGGTHCFSDAISITKRYLTSLFSIRS